MVVELGPPITCNGLSSYSASSSSSSLSPPGPGTPLPLSSPSSSSSSVSASPFVRSRSSSRRSDFHTRHTVGPSSTIDMSVERVFEFDCLRLVNPKPGQRNRQRRSRHGSTTTSDQSMMAMMTPCASQTSFEHDRGAGGSAGTYGRSSGSSSGSGPRSTLGASSRSADVGLDALGLSALSSASSNEKASKSKRERGTFLRLGSLGGLGQLVNKLESRRKESSETSEIDNLDDCYDGVRGTPRWREARIVVRATVAKATVDCYESDGVSFSLNPSHFVSSSISHPHRSLYSLPNTLKISGAPISLLPSDTYCPPRREPLSATTSPNHRKKANLSLSSLSSPVSTNIGTPPSSENSCLTPTVMSPTRKNSSKYSITSSDAGVSTIQSTQRPQKLRRSTPVVDGPIPSIPTRTISLPAGAKPLNAPESPTETVEPINLFSTELVFAFTSASQMHACAALLQSFSSGEVDKAPAPALDVHRRIEFVVGDAMLYETGLSHIVGRASASKTRDRSGSIAKALSGNTSDVAKLSQQRLAGLRCIIYMDGSPAAQTTMRADSVAPSWAESFTFDHTLDISRLHVELVYTFEHGQIVSLARAEVQMDSWALGKKHDMKYRLFSVDDGSEVGEIALKMKVDEIIVHEPARYQSLLSDITNANPSFMDKLSSITTADGATVSLCRIAIAQGSFKMLLLSLLKLEVQTPSATLFRGNTPLTRTLETVIRMYMTDFLRAALQPALLDICRNEATVHIETSKIPTQQEMRNDDHRMLRALADRLWRDIWATRAEFPPFLRILFAALKGSVAKHHQASQKVQYQAISSFLFLRLIGPSIMWPHLWGLLDWMPSPDVLQTLKLVAKPIMNLAFFVEGGERKEGYLAHWGPWFKENQNGMSDFLESCSTPQDEYVSVDAHACEIDVQLFLQDRQEASPECATVLTAVGSVEIHRELAWFDNVVQDVFHRKPPPPSQLATALLDERKARRASDVPVARRSRLQPKSASTTPSLNDDDDDNIGPQTDSVSLVDAIRSLPIGIDSRGGSPSHRRDASGDSGSNPSLNSRSRASGGLRLSFGSTRSSGKRSIVSAQSAHREITT